MAGEDKYIGKQIGNYRILASLDSGSFGNVYRGVHMYLSHRTVAIKLMHLTYLGSPQERESFLQEAQFLEMLKHPHILPIYDVGIYEGTPYIVAEFAVNGSLRDRILEHRPRLVAQKEVLAILSQVGEALNFVHGQNIVHRDLKPENILFNAREEAVIADFGIAVFLETTRTEHVDAIGSPLYMAPEQFEGYASRRSDQYSLACIAYELLTGRPPFTGQYAVAIGMKHQKEQPQPLRSINPHVPDHIEKAVLKALSKQREERYPDIPSFLADLKEQPPPGYKSDTTQGSNSVLFSIFTPQREVVRSKEEWVDEGNRLYNQGDYQEALKAFEYAIGADPEFADAYEGKSSALCALGRYQEAAKVIERALELDPGYGAAYKDKGDILYEFKRYADALACYEKALQLEPDNVNASLGRADTLSSLRRYEEALEGYDEVIRLDAACSPAYDGKAWVLRQLQRFEEALATSEEAVQLDPTNALAHMGKGRALFRLGRLEESLSALERAIRLDGQLAQAYDYKADTLYHMHRSEEALATYECAFQLNPHLASSYEGKGNVLFDSGHYQEALASYEQAVKLDPKSGAYLQKKGNALKMLGRQEEAEQVYEKARQSGYTG